jgi:hypothetical protein
MKLTRTPNRGGSPKVRTPDTYNGQRTELKRFLLQCDLYLELREKDFDNETDKVYFAIALLRGAAADWAEPYARGRLDNEAAAQSRETRTLFGDFDAFKQAITNMFGDVGEDRRAASELMTLRQSTTVVAYAAKFQQLQAKTGWDDKASVAQFYHGLNDRIKNQMDEDGEATETLKRYLPTNTANTLIRNALQNNEATKEVQIAGIGTTKTGYVIRFRDEKSTQTARSCTEWLEALTSINFSP